MDLLQCQKYLLTCAPVTWLSLHLEKLLIQALRQGPCPEHLAVVMDGNRRFAGKHNIPIETGHSLGLNAMTSNLEAAYTCGIRVVTIYVFSIENFKRPQDQVDWLMELFDLILHSLSEHDGILHRHGVSLRVLGRLDLLEPDFVSTIQHRAELTRDYGDKILNVCLSYTSRDEMTNAIRQTVTDCNIPTEVRSNLVRDTSIKRPDDFCAPSSLSDGHDEKSANVGQPVVICPQHITSATLTDRMLTAGDPPLDLLIRTSGTRRLSDFLLWQCCEETQIIFPETLWPDFGVWQFCSAVREWRRGRQMIMNERSKKGLLCQSFPALLDRIPKIANRHGNNPRSIQRDIKELRRLPEHLSVILSLRKKDNALQMLMDQVTELAAWSASAGITTLSIYEKSGTLKSYIPILHQSVTSKLSAYYGSLEQPPVVCILAPHHDPYFPVAQSASEKPTCLNLLLLSASDGQDALANLTKSLAELSHEGKLLPNDISMELVDAKISETISPSGPLCSVKPEPDLLLIAGPLFKLDGYPPWQIRLTEMYCTGEKSKGREKGVRYREFLRGLYQYAGADMKFGR